MSHDGDCSLSSTGVYLVPGDTIASSARPSGIITIRDHSIERLHHLQDPSGKHTPPYI